MSAESKPVVFVSNLSLHHFLLLIVGYYRSLALPDSLALKSFISSLKLGILSEGRFFNRPVRSSTNRSYRAARGRKVALLKKALEKYPRFEVVEIADVATADYTAAFKGVVAVIHTAAPLPGRADSETALNVSSFLSLPVPHLTENYRAPSRGPFTSFDRLRRPVSRSLSLQDR